MIKKVLNKKGFTLIELLVAIAIIGILATLTIVSLQTSRRGTRDAKRISDINQIQIALENYHRDFNEYPATITPNIATGNIIYLSNTPSAPYPPDGSCSVAENVYTYAATSSSYTINFCLGAKVSNLTSGKKLATPSGIVTPPRVWVCGDSLVDTRDSKEYPTVQIGTQCWTAKNMDYDNGCTSATWVNYSDAGWCGCYNSTPSYCTSNGKLYQWSASMAGSTTEGAQGVCPSGWHIPRYSEFLTLSSYLSANSQYWCNGNSTYVAKSLAVTSGWSSWTDTCVVGYTQSSNNSSGLSINPSGVRSRTNGAFFNITSNSTIISSTQYDANNKRVLEVFSSGNTFWNNWNSKQFAHSVRCLKN